RLARAHHVRARRAARLRHDREARRFFRLGPWRPVLLAADHRVDAADLPTRAADGDRGPGRLPMLLDPPDPHAFAGLRVGDEQRVAVDRGDALPDPLVDPDADAVLGIADLVRPWQRTPLATY